MSLKKCTSPFSISNFFHFSKLKSHVSFLCQISPFCCVRIACLFSMSNLSVSITYLSSNTTSASCHKYVHVYRGLPWAWGWSQCLFSMSALYHILLSLFYIKYSCLFSTWNLFCSPMLVFPASVTCQFSLSLFHVTFSCLFIILHLHVSMSLQISVSIFHVITSFLLFMSNFPVSCLAFKIEYRQIFP